MSHLLREFAPITEASWSLIDDEARERLTPALAARKLIDFAGPHGWKYSATNVGRTTPLADAAHRIATAENRAVFHGWPAADITGIAEASSHAPLALGEDCELYPSHVAKAVETLLQAGVEGPYGLALGPEPYKRVLETSEHGGYPLFNHLRQIIGGPLVWAPGVQGAVVVSQRGGDFLFDAGEDLAVGYDSHDADAVNLYLVESFTFRVATPEAAVALTP